MVFRSVFCCSQKKYREKCFIIDVKLSVVFCRTSEPFFDGLEKLGTGIDDFGGHAGVDYSCGKGRM